MILPTPADALFAAAYHTDTLFGGLFTVSLLNSSKIGSFTPTRIPTVHVLD